MEREFELNVELFHEKSEAVQTHILIFPSQPATFKEIERRVEECCNIPECVQTLFYQGSEIPDSTDPQSLYLRSGDTVRVSYPDKGLVSEVKSAMKWLQQSIDILAKFHKVQSSGMATNIPDESVAVLSDRTSRMLDKELFSPWTDPCTLVNAKHFDYLGGPQLLVDFHNCLIKLRKDGVCTDHRIHIPYFEFICCRSIANYAMNNTFSSRAAQCGGLDSCIGSFLIKPADDESLLMYNTYSVVVQALRAIFK